MQICFGRTNEDIWNWQTNIQSGADTLNTSRNSARNHLDAQNATDPYTDAMWRDEAVFRYHAGMAPITQWFDWVPDPNSTNPNDFIWVVDPMAISNKNLNYVNDVRNRPPCS